MTGFIFGIGGFAKEVTWLLRDATATGGDPPDLKGYVVEDGNPHVGGQFCGQPVLSETAFFERHAWEDNACYVALGQPDLRREVVARIKSRATLARFPTLIHPAALLASEPGASNVGEGTFICAQSILSCDVIVGDFVVVNWACSVGHESSLGSFTTLSPGVRISGNVRVGEGAFFGTNSCVVERTNVAAGCKLGAGCTLVRTVTEPGTYVAGVYIGQPGLRLKS